MPDCIWIGSLWREPSCAASTGATRMTSARWRATDRETRRMGTGSPLGARTPAPKPRRWPPAGRASRVVRARNALTDKLHDEMLVIAGERRHLKTKDRVRRSRSDRHHDRCGEGRGLDHQVTPKNGRLWERSAFSHRRSRATRETQAPEPTSRKWESWCATANGPAENGNGSFRTA